MAEMKEAQAKNKFGRVFIITEPDYKTEVSVASNETDVVLLLTCEGFFRHFSCYFLPSLLFFCSNRDVAKLEEIFNIVAPKYPQIKFVKIRGSDAIHNYPDQNCPTVLVYRKQEIIKNWVTARPFGGPSMSAKTFELELTKIGLISATSLLGLDDDRDVDVKMESSSKGGLSISLTAKRGKGRDDDDEDDDDSDPEKKARRHHTGGAADFGDTSGGWTEIKFDLK
jgi:hypothetical protein